MSKSLFLSYLEASRNILKYRFHLFACAALLLPLQLVLSATAADAPSGSVSIQATSVAAGVGVQWGEGTLTYNGKKYPFALQGLEVVGLGFSEVKAEGSVFNLTKLSDFEGVYAAAEAGVAAGSGPATITMRNPHGVTITLHAVQEGAKLTLAAGGVNIDLKG
jgi:outer membrane immunogenic protein